MPATVSFSGQARYSTQATLADSTTKQTQPTVSAAQQTHPADCIANSTGDNPCAAPH